MKQQRFYEMRESFKKELKNYEFVKNIITGILLLATVAIAISLSLTYIK